MVGENQKEDKGKDEEGVDIGAAQAPGKPNVEFESPGHSGLGGKKRKSKAKSKPKLKKRKPIVYSSSEEDDTESSSSNSSNSDSEWSTDSSEGHDYDHFEPIDRKTPLKLPTNLDKFAKRYFSSYLNPEAMTKVKEDCPLPKCSAFVIHKLDDDWREMMDEDKRNFPLLKQDRAMERIQSMLMTAMGPISKIWVALDQIQKQGGSGDADLPSMLKQIEKGIICLGQVNVHLNYYRRLPIVTKIMDSGKKAQKVLKKSSHRMKSKKLLGSKFQRIIQKTIKKKREARELKRDLLFSSQANKPFRSGPSSHDKAGGGQQQRRNQQDFKYRSPLQGLYQGNGRYESSQGVVKQTIDPFSQEKCSQGHTHGRGENPSRDC